MCLMVVDYFLLLPLSLANTGQCFMVLLMSRNVLNQTGEKAVLLLSSLCCMFLVILYTCGSSVRMFSI